MGGWDWWWGRKGASRGGAPGRRLSPPLAMPSLLLCCTFPLASPPLPTHVSCTFLLAYCPSPNPQPVPLPCRPPRSACGVKDEVLHDACLLLDRTVAAGGAGALALPPAALVVACVLITARQAGEPPERLPAEERLEAATGLAASAVAAAAAAVRSFLRADTSAISSLRVVKLYLERLGVDFGAGEESAAAAAGPALRALGPAACDPGLQDCRPSLLAAAVLRASRQAAGGQLRPCSTARPLCHPPACRTASAFWPAVCLQQGPLHCQGSSCSQ